MRKHKLVAVISLIVAAVVIYSCKTHFATTRANYTTNASPQAFERGKILVFSICAGCHYDHSVNKFIGTRIHNVPGIVGKVYSANLTNSQSNGIPPHYADAELKYLLKTGVAKNGRFIPYMLRPNMADEDIDAIIVYLRSNDAPVAAGDTTVGITHYSLVGKAFMNITAKPLPYKYDVKRPGENDMIGTGRYLIDNIGCFHCHSKSLTSLKYLNPEQSKGYMAGGLKLKDENGNDVYASNLTFDKNTGIGNFTALQFRKAVKEGESPERKLHAPMPKFQKLSDKEVDAIYNYLQTIPAKYHTVKG